MDSADRTLPVSLVERLSGEIRTRIATRALLPGAKLPSIRAFAETRGVSKSTVVEVYDRLAAEGQLRSRRGAGFYVTGATPPLAIADIAPRLDRMIDPFWISRLGLTPGDGYLKPGCGWLPPDWMPDDSLRRALRALAKADSTALIDYESPQGLPELRQLIAGRLRDYGVDAGPDQVTLTNSATQALDLLFRLLLSPGDTVLVDDPCYFNFLASLRAHRVNIVGVPYLANGPDVDALEAILQAHSPRLYLTNAGIQNPTGGRLSLAAAHRLLRIAEAHGLTIVEDDVFAGLEEEPAPRLAALDGLNRVVLIGGFSKTLSAAVRCGYIAMRRDWMEQLLDLKIATSITNCALSSRIVLHALKNGSYRRHVSGVRARLARARTRVSERLQALGIDPWLEPEAGIFLWCRLPAGADAADVTRNALRDKVVLAPGDVFSLSQSASRFMRFNVTQCDDPRVFDVLRKQLRGHYT